jgi:hypothetical protein
MLHRGDLRYQVFTTTQFDELWKAAIEINAIEPASGQTKLEGLILLLSRDPHCFPAFEAPGEVIDLRWVNFQPDSNPRVEIWYEVVEDDLQVYLTAVELIQPNQPSLPGFAF